MGQIQKYIIRDGQFTFGQRIELGEIITAQNTTEWEKFRQAIACLHPEYKVRYSVWEMEYWLEILNGIQWWIKREKSQLKYKPSTEEILAGVDQLSLEVGNMSTITALAEKFSQDPDEVLKWKYGKVFNILLTNLKSFEYKQRLENEIKKKHERKRKR